MGFLMWWPQADGVARTTVADARRGWGELANLGASTEPEPVARAARVQVAVEAAAMLGVDGTTLCRCVGALDDRGNFETLAEAAVEELLQVARLPLPETAGEPVPAVVLFADFLEAGWSAREAAEAARLGLTRAVAARFEEAQRGWVAVSETTARWQAVREAVGEDPAAVAAWRGCVRIADVPSSVVAKWHARVGVRGPVFVDAGITVGEFDEDPALFADGAAVAALALLRSPCAP